MKKVLENVEKVDWDTMPGVSMVGSLAATMRYLGEDVTNEWLMGVSVGAFFLYWLPPYAPSNCALHLIGQEPFERTFTALGYRYDYVQDYDLLDSSHTKEFFQTRIEAGIERGTPVLALGVVGPPEWCVITGCDEGALLGWSYFQGEDEKSYFRSEDWFQNLHGIVTVGERTVKPSSRETLRASLEWAIWLARTPAFEAEIDGKVGLQRHLNGFAAYDALVLALLSDEDWLVDDIEVQLMAVSADGLALLWQKRDFASKYCARMACLVPEVESDLTEAAKAYKQEADLLMANMGNLVFHFMPREAWKRMEDRSLREVLATVTREAKVFDERAVAHLEAALARL